jgi:hypothetical protein
MFIKCMIVREVEKCYLLYFLYVEIIINLLLILETVNVYFKSLLVFVYKT